MHDAIERYWQELTGALEAMPLRLLSRAVDVLLDCHWRGGTVFAVGNGGSAATASHFACDLAKGTLTPDLPAFRVVALTDNVPLLTAWANDTDYERVFAAQLAALVRPGDVLLAISASGNSSNVLASARVARDSGATVIALTGQSGGALRKLADLAIRVPAPNIEQVEDAHLMVAHSLCVTLRGQFAMRDTRRNKADVAVYPRLGRRQRAITIVERDEPVALSGEISEISEISEIDPPTVEAVGG